MLYDALQPLDTSTLDSPTCSMLACVFLLKRRHLITVVCLLNTSFFMNIIQNLNPSQRKCFAFLLSVSYFMNMIQKLKSFLLKSTPHLLNKVYCVIKIHCEIEIYLLIFVCFLKLYHIIKFYY